MTEQEAKTKWCPFTVSRKPDPDGQPREVLCIASDCMAWRWSQHKAQRGTLEPIKEEGGYCGLAERAP